MSPWLVIVPVACAALALKVAHDHREHDRRLRDQRERFVAYADRYANEWEHVR